MKVELLSQVAVNIADTRSWNTLPKQAHLARSIPPEGLTLSTTDDRFVSDLILDEKISMILVRQSE